jgi:hypothetical protein
MVSGMAIEYLEWQPVEGGLEASVVSTIKPYMGFDVEDHRIRGLMRFIEMTSRE